MKHIQAYHRFLNEKVEMAYSTINGKKIESSWAGSADNLKDFIKLSEFNKNIGIGLLPGTSDSELDEYLEYAHSVLLLGVNPGYSNQDQAIDLPKKVADFNTSFPHYSGEVIVDGGVKNEDLEVFEKIGVDVVVQGGAIFG